MQELENGFEVYKEKKYPTGWEYLYGSTKFFGSYVVARGYARGSTILLRKNERFILMNRTTQEKEVFDYDKRTKSNFSSNL